MIVPMARVRILGPREQLAPTLRALQDAGLLHVARPAHPERLLPAGPPDELDRERDGLHAALAELDLALVALGPTARAVRATGAPGSAPFEHPGGPGPERIASAARAVRAEAEALAARHATLVTEQVSLERYRTLHSAFAGLIAAERGWPDVAAFHVVLRHEQADLLPRLQAALAAALGDSFVVHRRELEGGETALLVLVPAALAARIDALLHEAQVRDVGVPSGYGRTLSEAMPAVLARLERIPGEQAALERARRELARRCAPELHAERRRLADALAQNEAREQARLTASAFVIEGWLPERSRAELHTWLARKLGPAVVVEELVRETWTAPDAPVALRNPRLFRPFEAITSLLPLPVYGSIDPTPYVAVFFPAFFGLIMGDIGLGLLLAAAGALLHRRSQPASFWRSASEIALASALFSVAFGIAFGELFGDLGHRWLGLGPLVFSREAALLPFLGLTLALGLVHVVLGIVLGAIARRHHPREALGRWLSAALVLLLAALLLAALGYLPVELFHPAAIAVLVLFPALVAVEGILAPLHLLSTLGHVLSYARIMALGTASVLLAVVANRMAGAFASAVVGAVFAILLHLVNFAIGLLSPTIHALRLHYVEFFGEFYSPGGVRYAPLRHSATEPAARA